MDLDDSKAHLIARRYLRINCNHSAACSVPPGTISLRLLPYMVTPPSIFGITQSLEGTLLTSLKIGPVYNEARLKHETEVIDKATNAIKDLIVVKDSKW